MDTYFLQVDSDNVGGYFSSEQIDLLSIVRCKSPEELINFINNCIQINGIYKNTDLYTMIENIGLEQAKRKVFKDYQDSMVSHYSGVDTVMVNTLKHFGIKDEDIQTIINKRLELSQNELIAWAKDFIINNYPDRSDEIFYAFQNYRSIERDQNKSENQYEEISILSNAIDIFDTMILGSGRIYNVLNSFYEENDKEKRYCFDRIKKDLDFAYKNGKQVRYHSLFVQEGIDKFFDGKSSVQIKEILKNYVKESINFINEYNATHKLNVDGKEVGAINSVVLFNEIVSFWKDSDGKYFNIWEEKYGITTKDIADIFEYAREHKPKGVSFIYNEPFLEDKERREKVVEVLKTIKDHSPGLIDTLGSQMHITIPLVDKDILDKEYNKLEDSDKKIVDYVISSSLSSVSDELKALLSEKIVNKDGVNKYLKLLKDYKNNNKDILLNNIKKAFYEFAKLNIQGTNIQITEFDLSISSDSIKYVFGDDPILTIDDVYRKKEELMVEISSIINEISRETGIHFDSISYWSLTDGVDFNLELVRSKLLKEGKIESIKEIPTVCGGLIPTHKKLANNNELNQMINNSNQSNIQSGRHR